MSLTGSELTAPVVPRAFGRPNAKRNALQTETKTRRAFPLDFILHAEHPA
jgi:hypothetical protein